MADYDNSGNLAPAAVLVFNATDEPEPVYTAEQIERSRAWLRDHYRDGTFRCPSSTDE